MLYRQARKNFVEQILTILVEVFKLSRWIWYKLCCRQAHQYIGGYSYIGR